MANLLPGKLNAIKSVNRNSKRDYCRVLLKSPPSSEKLKIDPFVYIPEELKRSGKKGKAEAVEDAEEDDKESEDKKQSAVN